MMRKSRKASIDFLPLLDVVLILLFAFLMMNATKMDAKADEMNAKDAEVLALADEIKTLENQQKALEERISDKEEETRLLNERNKEQQAAMNQVNQALSRFIEANSEQILEEAKASDATFDQKVINKFTNADELTKELMKYEAINKQFYFIDIVLKGSENRIYINNQSTSKGITSDILEDEDARKDKILEVRELIESDMMGRQGGAAMTFITLSVHDENVYQYAWKLVWEAIGEIQEKYGTDTIFRTSITLIEE